MFVYFLLICTDFFYFLFEFIKLTSKTKKKKTNIQRPILVEDLDDHEDQKRLHQFKIIVDKLNTFGHLTKLHELTTRVSKQMHQFLFVLYIFCF